MAFERGRRLWYRAWNRSGAATQTCRAAARPSDPASGTSRFFHRADHADLARCPVYAGQSLRGRLLDPLSRFFLGESYRQNSRHGGPDSVRFSTGKRVAPACGGNSCPSRIRSVVALSRRRLAHQAIRIRRKASLIFVEVDGVIVALLKEKRKVRRTAQRVRARSILRSLPFWNT